MKEQTFFAETGMPEIRMDELCPQETLARDYVAKAPSKGKAKTFGKVDLWNLRRTNKGRRNIFGRIL